MSARRPHGTERPKPHGVFLFVAAVIVVAAVVLAVWAATA